MKSVSFRFFFLIVLLGLPFAYAAYLYPDLPSRIPTHFNLKGEADAWGGKESIFLAPSILGFVSLFVYLLMSNIKKIDPKRYAKVDDKTYPQLALFTVAFMSILSLVILFVTVHKDVDVTKIVFGLLGVGFAGFGWYMPRLQPNYVAGFRLPWTLENENNWIATHQLAGKWWKIGGGLQVIAAILLNETALFIAFMGIMGLMVLIPLVFSYRMFKAGN